VEDDMTSTSNTTPTTVQGQPRHKSLNLAGVASAFVALFALSAILCFALANGQTMPTAFDSEDAMRSYFFVNADAVRVSTFLTFCATVPLAIFAAVSASRLRFLGVEIAGATIALVGGIGAAIMLACAALLRWVLAETLMAGQTGSLGAPGTFRAFHLLGFATGGPGFLVMLAVMVAAISVAAGMSRYIHRALMYYGIGCAVLCAICGFGLLSPVITSLSIVAVIATAVWMVVVGALLPRVPGDYVATEEGRAAPTAPLRPAYQE
jgi:hypothetical protein